MKPLLYLLGTWIIDQSGFFIVSCCFANLENRREAKLHSVESDLINVHIFFRTCLLSYQKKTKVALKDTKQIAHRFDYI